MGRITEEKDCGDDYASGRTTVPGFTSAERGCPQTLTDVDGDFSRESTSDEEFQARAAANERVNRRNYEPSKERE